MKTQLKGLKYQYKELYDWLKNWDHEAKKTFILWGYPGVGKTFMVHKVAEEQGFDVIEYNTSDQRNKKFMQHLKNVLRQQSFTRSIVLLDEADGVDSRAGLKDIVTKTQKPLILTANKINKLMSIRKLCKEKWVPKPKLSDTDENIKDYRQARMMKMGSQGYDPEISRYDKILRQAKEGKFNIDIVDATYLLDSSIQIYGFYAYELVKGLSCWDICKRDECMTGLKPDLKEIMNIWFSKKKTAAAKTTK